MGAALQVQGITGIAPVLTALGLSRATFYRRRRAGAQAVAQRRRPRPLRALGDKERTQVLEALHSPRFVDQAPAQVVATLLDEGRYLCSTRTMYRVLASAKEVRERRNQRRHPKYSKPELVASAPNEVWSWDITLLRTYVKWQYLYLYVLLDLFSRYVVGWLIAQSATAALARRLVAECCEREGIVPGSLIIHADRGPQMLALTRSQFLAKLGVSSSHSRPHVSNDNPFSESQFKTAKYHPGFPGRFASIEHGLDWGRGFFPWYNHEHHHSGLAYLTPAQVHSGRTAEVIRAREQTLTRAWHAHPERFVNGPPRILRPPSEVWINPPTDERRSIVVGLEETEQDPH
jgi:putative transposase